MMKIHAYFTRRVEDKSLAPDIRLDAWIQGYQLEHPHLSYAQASFAAARANPELHKEWLLSNG